MLFYQLYDEKYIEWNYKKEQEKFEMVTKITDAGKFALTMPFVNILNEAHLLQQFENNFRDNMLQGLEGEQKESVSKKLEQVLIYKKMMQGIKGKLLPFENIEYLINTGIGIKNEVRYRLTFEFSKSNMISLIREFWHLMEISLKEYDIISI